MTAFVDALPRQGDQGAPGAEPAQGARPAGAHRRRRTSTRRSTSSSRRRERAPDPLLTLEDAALGYAGRADPRAACSCRCARARASACSAPNGAGKSTLVKALAGELDAARRAAASKATASRSATSRSTSSSSCGRTNRRCGTCSCAGAARRASSSCAATSAASTSAATMADAPVGAFSGGEKSRLALALIVRRRPNLLLLDEPTNHLDLEMRHALTRALAEYEGSLVLVSHDRALLRTVCDGFLLVADGQASEFDGDVDDYLAWLDRAHGSPGNSTRRRDPALPDREARRAQRETANAERQARLARRRPLVKEADASRAGDRRPRGREARARDEARGRGVLRVRQRRRRARDDPALRPRSRACSRRPRSAGSRCSPSSRRSANPDQGGSSRLSSRPLRRGSGDGRVRRASDSRAAAWRVPSRPEQPERVRDARLAARREAVQRRAVRSSRRARRARSPSARRSRDGSRRRPAP